MRYFNTSGPCYPIEHYTLLREELISQGMDRVRRGRYVTIFAPRQAGKTTYFHQLIDALLTEGRFTPIWISFENLKKTTKTIFYDAFSHHLSRELSKAGITPPHKIKNGVDLINFFEEVRHLDQRQVMLIIDEFEGVPDKVLGELMHSFRLIYQQKENYALHSIILVGVSTISELVVSDASPFNVVDELKVPYFTEQEVRDLIGQYVEEVGQEFEEDVIRAIFYNTNGQPGLVCALCAYLVEEIAKDHTKPVTMDHFYVTLKHFLTERYDKNIINIVQKAKQRKDFMFRLLFRDRPITFTIDDEDISYLYAHGVVENVDGWVDITVPLYKKRLLTAFRPTFNGEMDHYFTAYDTFSEYFDGDDLNIKAIVNRYAEYVAKRGFRAFDTEHLKEGAWHYSLDGFFIFFIERIDGRTFVEVPTGRGRADILILYRKKKYIIETKIFNDKSSFERGKRQLAAYLKSEGLDEGYYVVFSKKHKEGDELEQEEMIDGKRIHTRLIRVNFEKPSDMS